MLPKCLRELVMTFLPRRRTLHEKLCVAAVDLTAWDPDHTTCIGRTMNCMMEDADDLANIAFRCVLPRDVSARSLRNKLEMVRLLEVMVGHECPHWTLCPDKAVFGSLRLWRHGVEPRDAAMLIARFRDARVLLKKANHVRGRAQRAFDDIAHIIHNWGKCVVRRPQWRF